MTKCDVGTLHNKGAAQQVHGSYMYYESPMLVSTQWDTTYTEHMPWSTHQPDTGVSEGEGVMSCAEMHTAVHRTRHRKNTHITVTT